MRVETNDRLVRRSRQIAQYLFFGIFATLIGAFLIINQVSATAETLSVLTLVQAILLPIAFIATLISVRMTNLWVRQPRPEDVIRDGLKGISNRSVLYNYFHLPARHLLITPQGVFAIVTRYHDGLFRVENDRWRAVRNPLMTVLSFLRFDTLGNPTADAQRAAKHIQALLEPIAPHVQVQPLIVFFDPRSAVDVVSSTVPVVQMETRGNKRVLMIRDVIKDVAADQPGASLTPEQIAQLEAATIKA